MPLTSAIPELSHPLATVRRLSDVGPHTAVELNFQGDPRVLERQVRVGDQAVCCDHPYMTYTIFVIFSSSLSSPTGDVI